MSIECLHYDLKQTNSSNKVPMQTWPHTLIHTYAHSHIHMLANPHTLTHISHKLSHAYTLVCTHIKGFLLDLSEDG